MPLNEINLFVILAVYIIVSAFFRSDPRISIVITLCLLIASAIMMVREMGDSAQGLAIFAFYFLVAAVVLLFIDYIREKPKGDN